MKPTDDGIHQKQDIDDEISKFAIKAHNKTGITGIIRQSTFTHLKTRKAHSVFFIFVFVFLPVWQFRKTSRRDAPVLWRGDARVAASNPRLWSQRYRIISYTMLSDISSFIRKSRMPNSGRGRTEDWRRRRRRGWRGNSARSWLETRRARAFVTHEVDISCSLCYSHELLTSRDGKFGVFSIFFPIFSHLSPFFVSLSCFFLKSASVSLFSFFSLWEYFLISPTQHGGSSRFPVFFQIFHFLLFFSSPL